MISNVPGPQFPLYCAGAELKAHYPVSVITDGMGLNITVMSYNGELDWGIVADREQMPDVDRLLDWLREGLDELKPPPARGNGAAKKRRQAGAAQARSREEVLTAGPGLDELLPGPAVEERQVGRRAGALGCHSYIRRGSRHFATSAVPKRFSMTAAVAAAARRQADGLSVRTA